MEWEDEKKAKRKQIHGVKVKRFLLYDSMQTGLII